MGMAVAIIQAIILIFTVLLIILLLFRRQDSIPQILQGAKLQLSERILTIQQPVALSGKPDQVWRATDGTLVIVDTKVRKRAIVRQSDILQLSAYAMLLNRTYRDLETHGTAFIRIPGAFSAQFLPVELLSETAVVEAHDRYWQLMEGRAMPDANGEAGLCYHCGHRAVCPRHI